jgi:LPPG:FO 2-phospho-L-lactate transferase
MIVVLAGGVGAARFLDGLARVVPVESLFIIGNTGDDTEIYGLHISPDIDTVVYTLAGLANPIEGWGIRGDSFRCLESLGRLGEKTWFRLGDCDLAMHIHRTARLRSGSTLSEVTAEIARNLGVRAVVRPMSDQTVRTIVHTPAGLLEFQTYFVRRRARDRVSRITFRGAEQARPAPGLLKAIRDASAIIFSPSNPIISIGPILAIPGIRRALERRRCRSVAISPIVAGRALKGPAAQMMKGMGLKASALGVAELYRGLVDVFVLDRQDRDLAPSIEKLGMRAVVVNTIMSSAARKKALSQSVVKVAELK